MSVEITPYFVPDERYPSLIGVRADGDEYETAYVNKHELMSAMRERDELCRDLYATLLEYGCMPNTHRADYGWRLRELGIEVDG